jgi:hypothetical protein
MATAVVFGGKAGVRVIVDAKNDESFEVESGESRTVEYKGLLELRTLGLDPALGTFLSDNDTKGADGNAG